MSDRLTPLWTETAGEAFGESGNKGRVGEVLVLNKLVEQSLPAIDFEEDRYKQVTGVDIQSGSYTLDIKANLHEKAFFIEVDPEGWLFHPFKCSDIIVHVDIDCGDIVWYRRACAKTKLRCNPLRPLVRIHEGNFKPEWMSRSWEDLFQLLRS